MARKKKMMPVQRHLVGGGILVPDNSDLYIDVAQWLSVVNRRMYRQGRTYRCRVTVIDANASPDNKTFVQVGSAWNTWMTKAAWNKAYDMYKKQMKGSPLKPGPWRDFKVALDAGDSPAARLIPDDFNGNPLALGEWENSHLFGRETDGSASDEDGDEVDVFLHGPSVGSQGAYTSIGLVHQYSLSRAVVSPQPAEFTAASDSFYAAVDGTSDAIVQDIETFGDAAPYPNSAVGGSTNGATSATVGAGIVSGGNAGLYQTPFFDAPCGLIKVGVSDLVDETANNLMVVIEVAPGDYKGVHAPTMVQ